MKFHPYSIGAVDCSFNANVYNLDYMHSFIITMVDNTWEVTRYCIGEMSHEPVITFSKDMTVDELIGFITPTCPTATILFIEIIKSEYKHLING